MRVLLVPATDNHLHLCWGTGVYRASNEPLRRLKFHNRAAGPYYLLVVAFNQALAVAFSVINFNLRDGSLKALLSSCY